MKNLTRKGFPRTTASLSIRTAIRKGYYVNTQTGLVYNPKGQLVGTSSYSPKLTVHLENGKKYGLPISRLVAFCVFGTQALQKGVKIRHLDANRWNNSGTNLEMQYTRTTRKHATRIAA